jgi:TetR/AcrR family transcriptional repressor of nem operon
VVAHQGGAMVSHATDDAEPMQATVVAAADYVCSFVPGPTPRRTPRTPRRGAKS